jgi:hypothetical protein
MTFNEFITQHSGQVINADILARWQGRIVDQCTDGGAATSPSHSRCLSVIAARQQDRDRRMQIKLMVDKRTPRFDTGEFGLLLRND